MDDKKIEIALTVAVAVFVLGFIGAAAWWIGNQGTGAVVTGANSSVTTTAKTGHSGLFPEPDRSGEADQARMSGRVTVNGQLPEMEKRTLADGTAYGGIVRLNYSQEQKYVTLTAGSASTGGLIDMSGNYSIDDVYEGVPFTTTVTLYMENEKEPLVRLITTDSGGPVQFTSDGRLVRDLDVIA